MMRGIREFLRGKSTESRMLQLDEQAVRDFDLHKRIQNLRHWRKLNRLEEELEWISFGVITSSQEMLDSINADGKCPLHCILESFLEMKFVDKRDGDIVELMMIKSRIDYEKYNEGCVLELLKRYNRIKYYQWLILNYKEHVCLEDMNANIFTKDTLIRISRNLDDLLQIVFVVGALKTLKVLMNMINEEYGSSYPVLTTAVSYSILVREGCNHKFYRCFDYLLNRADVDINLPDKNGETAFFLACKVNDQYMISELLKKKPFIAALNKEGNYAVSELSPEVLESILDSCIVAKPNNFIKDESALKFMKMFSLKMLNLEHNIFMDLRNFYPAEDYGISDRTFNVLELIQSIAATKELGPILNHPVIGTILEAKWARLRKFIILRKLGTFIPFLVAFILRDSVVTGIELKFTLFFIGLALALEAIAAGMLLTSKFCIRRIGFVSVIILILVFAFFASGICNQVAPLPDIQNRFSDTIHLSTPGQGCPAVGGTMWIFLGMSINYVLAFFNPTIAHYSIMMIYVAHTMLKFLISNIFLVAGFVISYAAIFREIESHDTYNLNYLNGSNILNYSFKAFVMLTGEISDEPNEEKHTIWTYLAFSFLIFMIPIVTLNLLNGLAISNVDYVSSQAIYWHRRVQCLLLYELEVILRKIEHLLQKFRPKMNFCSRFIKETSLIGIRKNNGEVLRYEKLTHQKKIATLTMETVKEALKILKKREQQEKYDDVMAVRKGSQSACPHCFETLESTA